MRKRNIANHKAIEISEFTSELFDEFAKNQKIDLLALAKNEDITYSFGDYADFFDGILEATRNNFHIYSNLNRGNAIETGRGRFTFAHELGHYFIDEHRRALVKGGLLHQSKGNATGATRVEAEADYFAASLLMPEKNIRQFLKNKSYAISHIREIAESFHTSIQSSGIRYVDLDITPCAIAKFGPNGKHWSAVSESLQNQGFSFVKMTTEKLYKGCATLLAKNGELLAEESKPTTAQLWFYTSEFRNRDMLFREEAISLGKHGVLTLLTPLE